MPVLELTEREAQTLQGVLLVEQNDLKELIADEKNAKDKEELEAELARVKSILQKLN